MKKRKKSTMDKFTTHVLGMRQFGKTIHPGVGNIHFQGMKGNHNLLFPRLRGRVACHHGLVGLYQVISER